MERITKSTKNIQKAGNRKTILFFMVFTAIVVTGMMISGCSKDDAPDEPNVELSITGLSIPEELDAPEGGELTLTGKGFAEGDHIRLSLASNTSLQFTVDVKSVTGQSVTFPVPEGIPSGDYSLVVLRGTESAFLGSATLNLVANIPVPDISGMTVKGAVSCNGTGIPDVVVSDGYEVTKTNANGIYYLPSQKKHGFVFISIPGDYEAANEKNIPLFYKPVTKGTSVERRDFVLTPTSNTKHVILAMADWHLAGINDDLTQFNQGFLPDVNALIQGYQAKGVKVYGVTLGDMSWDTYWYSKSFGLPEYLTNMQKLNCPVFNTMGNHDNDPYSEGDWNAEKAFRTNIGPTYYSFNLGKIHYVVLDNIEYLNTGGAPGVMGQKNYNNKLISDQLEWLKKDIAMITDKTTPMIVAMHINLHQNPTLNGNGDQVNKVALANGNELISVFESFSNVHFLTGHTHYNFTVEAKPSLMEHNIAAVCATWWWTGKSGFAGNHICKDGSPGGYSVWEIDDKDVKWYYKSIGFEKEYQFRVYDLNKTHITNEKYAPNATYLPAEYAPDYAYSSDKNEVLVNVWGYDSQWKIEIKENNQPLPVKRVTAKDPLHIISYQAKCYNTTVQLPSSDFVTSTTAHMFRATASSPTSALEIKVTDRFGDVYAETMVRPKELTWSMN